MEIFVRLFRKFVLTRFLNVELFVEKNSGVPKAKRCKKNKKWYHWSLTCKLCVARSGYYVFYMYYYLTVFVYWCRVCKNNIKCNLGT